MLKLIPILLLLGPLVNCDLSRDESDNNSLRLAHGFWQADSGDAIPNGPGVLVYNWYAIDTDGTEYPISVTWDNGLTCTITEASFEEDKVFMTVGDYFCEFKIEDSKRITLTITYEDAKFIKHLTKERDSAEVFCL